MAIRPAGGGTCATATKSVAARLCLDRPPLGSARSIGFGPAAIPDGIRRQITILLVPFRRSSQPLIEANAGPVADFPLRLVDIESAILPEPVSRSEARRVGKECDCTCISGW